MGIIIIYPFVTPSLSTETADEEVAAVTDDAQHPPEQMNGAVDVSSPHETIAEIEET